MSATSPGAGDPAWPGAIQHRPASIARFGVLSLDEPDAVTFAGDEPRCRVLWVSCEHPCRVAGALWDQDAFEGAWMDGQLAGCFRLQGVTSRVPAPVLHSAAEARRWLADELARRCAAPGEAVAKVGLASKSMAA